MLITLYGINNIGKSTHAKRLVERLKNEGKDVVYLKYPVYEIEPTGVFLNKILRSGEAQKISEEELQMWFTLNRYQFQPELQKMLDEGKYVVAEDYVGTGIAWGTAKGASTDWLENLNKYLIKEDLAILIDGERAESSIEEGHIHETNNELIKKCRETLLLLADKYGWQKVALQESKDETEKLVWETVSSHI